MAHSVSEQDREAFASITVRNAFELVTQRVAQLRSLSWLSYCKLGKVVEVARAGMPGKVI